jgi:hypothetical protein
VNPENRVNPASPETAGGQNFRYEPVERFGEGLTTSRPWNTTALAGVERLNGRVAMLGFAAAIVGELISGRGPAGQVLALLGWSLN